MVGLSAPETAREDTVRIACLVVSTLVLTIGASLVGFLWLDRSAVPRLSTTVTWMPAPCSTERSIARPDNGTPR